MHVFEEYEGGHGMRSTLGRMEAKVLPFFSRVLAAEQMPTAVEDVSEATAVPVIYALSQNTPNPFNAQTAIAFDLPCPARAKLSVYTITGQEVRRLVDGAKEPGHHQVIWDGKDEEGGENEIPKGTEPRTHSSNIHYCLCDYNLNTHQCHYSRANDSIGGGF